MGCGGMGEVSFIILSTTYVVLTFYPFYLAEKDITAYLLLCLLGRKSCADYVEGVTQSIDLPATSISLKVSSFIYHLTIVKRTARI